MSDGTPDARTLACPICNHKGLTETDFCYFSSPLMQEYECPNCGTKGTVGFTDMTHTDVSYGYWQPLTKVFFMQNDYTPCAELPVYMEFDGVRYDPRKIRYLTRKLIIMTDGTVVRLRGKA